MSRARTAVGDAEEKGPREARGTEGEAPPLQELPPLTELLPMVSYSRQLGGDFRFVHVSPSCVEVTGYSPRDFLESPAFWSDRVHPMDARVVSELSRLLTDAQLEVEYRFLIADGTYRWFRDVCRVVRQPDGEAWAMGLWRDVTPRKVVEEELRATQERLRQIIDLVPHMIYVKDAEGRFLLANRAMADAYGAGVEALLGADQRSLHPQPEEAERMLAADREVLATGLPLCIPEQAFTDTRGERRILQTTKIPFHESVSQRPAVLGISEDISERLQAQRQLRRQQELFRLAFEHGPLAIVTCSPEGRFLSVNRAARELFGYTQEEFLALGVDDLTHPDDRPVGLDLSRWLEEEQGDSISYEKRYVRKDGSAFHGEVRVSVARDEAGKPVLLIGQIEDLTERLESQQEDRRQRERLAHVARLGTMGEMAAGIAHEVNQPLTAIANYAQACRRFVTAGKADAEELLAVLEKVGNQAQRAGEVIRRLRDLVRKRETCRDLVRLDELVADVVKLAELDARLQGVRIRVELGAGEASVVADTVQIQQVVLNLIRNAMEASLEEAGEPGRVPAELIVRTRRAADEALEVAVQDHGVGLSPEVADKVFSPFFSTKRSGMGLGLSISRSIIASHGGRLWFTANADRGTTFHFTLPTILNA